MHFPGQDQAQAAAIKGLSQIANVTSNRLNSCFWVGTTCWIDERLFVRILAMDSSGVTFEVIQDREKLLRPEKIYFSVWPKSDTLQPILRLEARGDEA